MCCSALLYSSDRGSDPGSNLKNTDGGKKSNPVGLDDAPVVFAVFQNQPNPFNPVTIIKFILPELSVYTFKVYDMSGREIYSINDIAWEGSHEIQFDGSGLASGIYIYTLQTDKYRDTKKMLLIK